MGDDADDDEGEFGGAYEDGHWIWDDLSKSLVFVSDRPPERELSVAIAIGVPTGTIDFKDDIDLLEQLRFRKRYARKVKAGQPDIITLQDVKDIAIFTAPLAVLSCSLINLLHLPTTERFIRALILYCQYYLQISEEMARRIIELESKIRTPESDVVEAEYKDNLSDLRALVAKEYSILLIGGAETKNYHHMGPKKKRRSLSDKDARLMETLLRMCIQIVWLALTRRCFNKIELEINRLFKSDNFNSVEHMLRTNYIGKMTKEEREVMLGKCIRRDKKLNTGSPLMNEAFCDRPIDYRMMGIGVIQYEHLPDRLRYMQCALTAPEEELTANGVVLGILGLPRSYFDTMLKVLPTAIPKKSKSSIGSSSSVKSTKSAPLGGKSSLGVTASKKSEKRVQECTVYGEICLPYKDPHMLEHELPPSFPDAPAPPRPCSEEQRKRWLVRLYRMLHPPRHRRKSSVSERRKSSTSSHQSPHRN